MVLAVPICSGLSSANSVKSNESSMGRGSDATQNNNMLGITETTLKHLKPKVFMFENAYKLATPLGAEFRAKLQALANSYGYSTTIVKVNTMNHGLPQNRTRTFFYAWRESKSAFIPEFKEAEKHSIMDVIGDLKNDVPDNDVIDFTPWLKYIKTKFGSRYREGMESVGGAIDMVIRKYDDFDYAKQFFDEKMQKKLDFWKQKKAEGKGWMTGAPVYTGPYKIPSIYKRSMVRLMHPLEDRAYSLREIMRLMGLPDDMKIPKKTFMIGQSVPVCTAEYYCGQIKNFLDGKLKQSSDKNVILDFCNVKHKSAVVTGMMLACDH